MLIVNADDLAMTPGANAGIFKGYDNGLINYASIMANCDYFNEAIDGAKKRPALNIGMHLNLTYGKSLTKNPLFCNSKGEFNLGYKELLLTKNQEFLEAIESEWEEQIKRVLDFNIKLTHIDSHRHIHLIPHLYPIVIKLAKKYNINRVRLIKEGLFSSLALTKRANFILNGGIIKYALLRGFSIIDAKYKDLYKDINFYSILYTGVVSKEILQKLKNSSKTYEIMVHPSIIELDKDIYFYDEAEKAYRVSKDREKELEAVLLDA
jgi:predicted glycoside hydrolase/deacetylase ChbG (UPF0249 family)